MRICSSASREVSKPLPLRYSRRRCASFKRRLNQRRRRRRRRRRSGPDVLSACLCCPYCCWPPGWFELKPLSHFPHYLQEVQCGRLTTLAVPCFDGCFLPKQEAEFVHLVLDELDRYRHETRRHRVLVFPPLPSRLRFLVHRTVEAEQDLDSFSVGQDWARRVVVCFSDLRGDVEQDGDPETDRRRSTGEEVLTPPSTRGPMDRAAAPGPRGGAGRTRAAKRSDRALYVPQAARERPSASKRPPAPARGAEPPGSSSCGSPSESRLRTDVVGDAKASRVPDVDLLPGTAHNGVCGGGGGVLSSPPQDTQAALIAEPKTTWTPSFSFEQTLSSLSVMSLHRDRRGDRRGDGQRQPEGEAEGGDHEGRREETAGPCDGAPASDMSTVTTELTDEICAGLKAADAVAIDHVCNDYSGFESVLIDYGEFGHVIEIYGFPAMLRTEDLMDAFTDYSDGGMKITWVDNTHALAVFSSQEAALQALSIRHPLLKTCTLPQASKQSQAKAGRRAEFIQPVKERPKTDSAVARRMVTRALGLPRGRGKRC